VKINKLWTVVFAMMIFLSACTQDAPTWQEQYDMGVRYLSEGSYEEAIITFTAAIEIDPKQALAYVGRGDAYLGLTEYGLAELEFNKALELAPALDLSERLENIEKGCNAQQLAELKESLKPALEQLDIPFVVDDISLGESSIASAKSAYAGRPYAYSNLMNDNMEDTVYTCFGMNDTPIPDGYEASEFGFLFSEYVDGGGIHSIEIKDPSFTCLGGLHIGDMANVALEYFGLPDSMPVGTLEWELADDTTFSYIAADAQNYEILYQSGNRWDRIEIMNGMIHRIHLEEER